MQRAFERISAGAAMLHAANPNWRLVLFAPVTIPLTRH